MQQYCIAQSHSKSQARIYFLIAAIVVVQLLSHRTSYSQNTNYFTEHYTIDDGLPSNLVEDIEWDSNNFLWISTFKGIGRFDGKWIQPFSLRNGDMIQTDYCGPFFKDQNGSLFFGDALGNIYRTEKSRPVIADSSYRVVKPEVNPRAFQLPKAFWSKFYKGYYHQFTYSYGPSPIIIDDNRILLTDPKSLYVYNRLTDTCKLIKSNATKARLLQIDGLKFLYEQGKEVLRIDLSPEKEIRLTPIQTGFPLHGAEIFWRTGMQNAIMVQANNCWLLQLENGQLTRTLLCDNIPANISISSIRYNKDLHIVAIAVDGRGVYVFRKKVFTSYINNTASILSDVHSYCSAVEVNPNELVLNNKTSLNLVSGKYKPQNIFPDFSSRLKIKDSIIFVCNDSSHFFSWSYKERKLVQRHTPPTVFDVSAFATTQGRVFNVNNNNIIEFSATKDSVLFSMNSNSPSLARDMIAYKPGYLVFAGLQGLYGFDIRTKKMDTLYKDGNKTFRGITQYKDYIFIACYESDAGLFAYKDGVVKKFPLDIHHHILNAHNIYIDRNNYVWISTNAGILKTKAKALTDYFNGQASYVGYEFLGKEAGVDIAELNGGFQGSINELKSGKICYTGINGVVVADILSPDTVRIPSYISVDKVTANDSLIYLEPSGHIQLSADTKKIRLHLAIPLWNNIKSQLIEYKLNGYNDQWETLDYAKQNFIELSNIPNGNYTVSIRTVSIYDKTIISTYDLYFGIDALWYKTRLFYITILFISLFFIWGIVTWRNMYLQKRNKLLSATVHKQVQEIHSSKLQLEDQVAKMKTYQTKLEQDYALKNRLISMIGHDMITPLRFMSNAGNKLIDHKDDISPETYDDTMRTIVETSNNLRDMSTNMLNWIKHHSDNTRFAVEVFDLRTVTQSIVDNATPIAKFKQVNIYNNILENIALQQFIEPYKSIVYQLLSNGIKHCSDCDITITAINTSDTITLLVKDEGPGMSEQQIEYIINFGNDKDDAIRYQNKKQGFGYLIIKDMLQILKASISIKSKLDEGTVIYVEIPKKIT